MSLVPWGDAADSVEGGKTEDGGGVLSDNVSDFGGRAVDRIFSTGDNDGVTDEVTEWVDKDGKGYVFENDSDDRAGAEDDALNFGDRVAGGITWALRQRRQRRPFEDDNDSRAGATIGLRVATGNDEAVGGSPRTVEILVKAKKLWYFDNKMTYSMYWY